MIELSTSSLIGMSFGTRGSDVRIISLRPSFPPLCGVPGKSMAMIAAMIGFVALAGCSTSAIIPDVGVRHDAVARVEARPDLTHLCPDCTDPWYNGPPPRHTDGKGKRGGKRR